MYKVGDIIENLLTGEVGRVLIAHVDIVIVDVKGQNKQMPINQIVHFDNPEKERAKRFLASMLAAKKLSRKRISKN